MNEDWLEFMSRRGEQLMRRRRDAWQIDHLYAPQLEPVGQAPRARLDSIDPFSYRNGIVAPV